MFQNYLILSGRLNIASAITLLGLFLSLCACVLALDRNLPLAIICLIYSGICDLFDGLVARLLNQSVEQQEFGLQIDTIVDMASFGITPTIIAYALGVGNQIWEVILLTIFASCAALRLAYFNIHGTTESGEIKFYTGLPVTYIALLFPIVYTTRGLLSEEIFEWLIKVFLMLIALLFILKIPVPKPKGVFYLIFPTLAIALTWYLLFF
jgi:CDP-diacylglycerol---serine O-phosphatidyltransferase